MLHEHGPRPLPDVAAAPVELHRAPLAGAAAAAEEAGAVPAHRGTERPAQLQGRLRPGSLLAFAGATRAAVLRCFRRAPAFRRGLPASGARRPGVLTVAARRRVAR